MHLSVKSKKHLILNITLPTIVLISFSLSAAQYTGEQYLLEKDMEQKMFQGTLQVQDQEQLPFFEIPEPNQNPTQSAGQIKAAYRNVLNLITQNKLDKARKKVESLIQENPEQSIYYNLRALFQLMDNNRSGAQQSFQKAIELNENNSQAYTGLSIIALTDKQPEKAEMLAKKALEKSAYEVGAYKILATITMQKEGIDATESLLLDAQKKVNDNLATEIEVLNTLVQVYTLKKQPEKLLPLADNLLERYPGNASALSYLAGVQLINKDDVGAEKTLRQLIAMQPEDGNYRYILARLLGKQAGKEAEILELLNKAALSIDNPTLALSYKTIILTRQKKYQKALAIAQSIDQSNPSINLGKLLKGDIYFAEKKYPQALNNYQLAYQMKPSIKTLDAILRIKSIQNQDKEAQTLLEKELVKDNESIPIRLRLATSYQKSKDYDLAIKQYEHVLAKQPDNPVVLNNLAWIYSQNKHPKALELAKKAHEKAPKSGIIADTYGYILLNYGKPGESLKVLKHATELAPDLTIAQLHLAEAYIANQQLSQAKEILQRIISKEGPEKSEAIKLMQGL